MAHSPGAQKTNENYVAKPVKPSDHQRVLGDIGILV